MIRYIAITATALSIATAVPASAGPITTLGECYTAVINWCVETFPDHAGECGQSSGLDDCDEEFGNAAHNAGLSIQRTGPSMPARTYARLVSGARLVRASR
jgi:hypothetical protein